MALAEGRCQIAAIYEKAPRVKRAACSSSGDQLGASPSIPAGIYSHSGSSSSWLGCMRGSVRFGAAISKSRSLAPAALRSPRNRAGSRRSALLCWGRSGRLGRAFGFEVGVVHLAGQPQAVEHDGELASYGDSRSCSVAFAAASSKACTKPFQVARW